MTQQNKHTPPTAEQIEALKYSVYHGYTGLSDHDILVALLAEVEALKAENRRLKNDLLDALDLKEGNGPTALSMVAADRDHRKASERELYEVLKEMAVVIEAQHQALRHFEAIDSIVQAEYSEATTKLNFLFSRYEEANKPEPQQS